MGSLDVLLETDRLRLRQFTSADIDNLVALDGDPEVMRYLTGGRPITRDQIERQELPRFFDYYRRYRGLGYWAAEEKPSDRFVGYFEFRPFRDETPEVVELGYRLVRSAWGHGFATESSRALIEKGFRELGVKRVLATTMAVNTASRRVMEKVGLRYVRTYYGNWPEPIEGNEQGDVE